MPLKRALLIIIAVSVVLRVGSALYQGSDVDSLPGVTDQITYHELAQRVLGGHGFSFATGWWPATRANSPTAHWSYLYTLFLSAVYAIFGVAPIAARILQALVVGVLHPLLAWRIGRRLFGPAIGIASAALTAVYLYFVFYAGALVTESLYLLAILWVLDLTTAIAFTDNDHQRAASTAPWILLGLACAICVLLRQLFLLMVPAILAWLAWQLTRGRAGAATLTPPAFAVRFAATTAVIVICILPWTARNYRAFGEFVPLNTNAGFAFYWGNHPVHGTRFIPILPSDPAVNYGTLIPREFRHLNEAQLDRALLLSGLAFVRDDPWRYARLSLSRVTEYFKFWPTSDSGLMSNLTRTLSFGLLLPFLLFGLVLTFSGSAAHRSKDLSGAALLAMVAGLYTVIHLLTWTLVRYRLPVDAISMPFAAVGLVALLERLATPIRLSNSRFCFLHADDHVS